MILRIVGIFGLGFLQGQVLRLRLESYHRGIRYEVFPWLVSLYKIQRDPCIRGPGGRDHPEGKKGRQV